MIFHISGKSRFGGPARSQALQNLTKHPIGLKMVPNWPGWRLVNLSIYVMLFSASICVICIHYRWSNMNMKIKLVNQSVFFSYNYILSTIKRSVNYNFESFGAQNVDVSRWVSDWNICIQMWSPACLTTSFGKHNNLCLWNQSVRRQ